MKAIRAGYTRHPWIALLLDIAIVIFFATRGRASHDLGIGMLEILLTAMPFLLALVAAWIFVGIAGQLRIVLLAPTRLWAAGVIIWVMTVFGGVGIRLMTGDTAAMPFVLVTAGLLGALFLLPRLLLHSDRAFAEWLEERNSSAA